MKSHRDNDGRFTQARASVMNIMRGLLGPAALRRLGQKILSDGLATAVEQLLTHKLTWSLILSGAATTATFLRGAAPAYLLILVPCVTCAIFPPRWASLHVRIYLSITAVAVFLVGQ